MWLKIEIQDSDRNKRLLWQARSVCLSGYSQPHILYSSSSSSLSPSNSSIKLVLSVWIFLFSYSSSSSPSKFKEHCGRWTGKVLLFWGFSNSIFSSHGHHWETTSWHCFLAHRLETFSFGQSSKPNTFKFFLLLCISAQRRTVSRMSRNFRKIVDIFAASLDLHWNVSIEKCKLFNQRLHLNEK